MATKNTMAPDPAFAIASTIVAMGGIIMVGFQVAFSGLGITSLFETEDLIGSMIRLAGMSGILATLAALPFARPLLRAARRSVWLASIQLIVGSACMCLFFPGDLVYATL